MTPAVILTSMAILGGVALTFAVLIAVARRKLWVWEDQRIEAVSEMLPNTNCGACGTPGCRAFAEALVAGKVQPAQCTVMSAEDREAVAAYLGVEAGEAVKRVARLLCAGGWDVAAQKAEYLGIETCAAAAALGGDKACAWACLGYGDCVRACSFDAMYMNAFGLPVVLPEPCTACGDCVEVCPRDLLVLMPVTQKLLVQCRSLLEGEEATKLCQVACNGCGLCAKDAAPGLIAIEDGLAVIDYSKNELASPDATRRCPTGAIVWVEGRQFAGTRYEVPAPMSPASAGVM